ncbi:MAG TPA: cupredoxin domain-containing protein [Acidimicrobiales bacterium]|jgi:plastocyanin
MNRPVSLARSVALVLALTILMAACGSDGGGSDETVEPITVTDGDTVTIVSKGVAFDVAEIEAGVGDSITFVHDHQDGNLPHNIRINELDVQTDVVTGPTTQTLDVTFDEAGSYTFVCIVHPQMTGTIFVE